MTTYDVQIGPHEICIRAKSAAVAPAVATQKLAEAMADFDVTRYSESDIRVKEVG